MLYRFFQVAQKCIRKTIEIIQILPKNADVIQSIAFYIEGIFMNQAENWNVDVSNKWIHENEILINMIIVSWYNKKIYQKMQHFCAT